MAKDANFTSSIKYNKLMDLRPITKKQQKEYNLKVTHLMQSWQWGEFRQNLGTPVLRYGLYHQGKLDKAFQLTLHKIPLSSFYLGYLPKGPYPDEELAQALAEIGRQHHCAFIKIEPHVLVNDTGGKVISQKFKVSPKTLFTKYNYVLNLTESEEEILQKMHPKFRYNIKVAQKHKVVVEERSDEEALEIHLKLYFATTQRQRYLGHNPNYHHQAWQTLKKSGMVKILIAFYTAEQGEKVPLASWMLVNFKDTLYYPYGGSSDQYKNVMASNLVAWEAIKLGKRLGLKKFDLWGAASPQAPSSDPYQGFTQFKAKMGAELEGYLGTFDLILNIPVYLLVNTLEKFTLLKVTLLKLFASQH